MLPAAEAPPTAGLQRLAPRRSAVASVVVWLAFLVACAAVPSSLAVGAEPGAWEGVVGFDGVYRTGSWTPLLITPATATRVWIEDPDGELVGYPAVEDTTGEGAGHKPCRFRVRFGRPAGRVLVEDDRGAQAPLRLPLPLESSNEVLLVIGDLPSAERAARLLQQEDGERIRVVALPDASGLGPTGLDLDGADAIVVCGSAVKSAPSAALAGVDAWVRRGGRLVFLAGASAAPTGPPSPAPSAAP
jgi:hypothetical protein